MRQVRPLKVREFVDQLGRCPFREWLDSLETPVKARIQARILRIESGNMGDHKPVGAGVLELRFDFGPGYRVYFGLEGKTMVLLLIGGDKSSQRQDIKRAQKFWSEYLNGAKDA